MLGPDDVLPFLPQRAPEGSVALLVGIFLSPLLAAAFPAVLDALRKAGYRIALDTGWPPEGWTVSASRRVLRVAPRNRPDPDQRGGGVGYRPRGDA